MKVLITGANGLLGSTLSGVLKSKGYDTVPISRDNLNIINRSNVFERFSKVNPDIVIHCAAYTDVESSEQQTNKAYAINTIGTENIVAACRQSDSKLVFISSTGVYGTSKSDIPYDEFDDVEPTTVHHHSKYEAEKVVDRHLSNYLIIRTGWLFGGNIEHSKNFVYKRYLEAKNSKVIYSDTTQIGNPTSVKNLSNQIELLIKTHCLGVFNCVDKASCVSRFDYVKKIVELFELPCQVAPAKPGQFIRKAPVSHNESASNRKLDLYGINIMSDWDASLADYIAELEVEL